MARKSKICREKAIEYARRLLGHSNISTSLGFAIFWGVVAAAFVCWAIGGVLGLGLATLSPDF
jgi:hypothetical protein